MARKVVRRGLNVRQTEKLVKPASAKRNQKSKPLAKDVDTLALERDLAALLGLKVDIKFMGKGGSLTVHYDSLEQLDDILHRLSKGEHGRPVALACDSSYAWSPPSARHHRCHVSTVRNTVGFEL